MRILEKNAKFEKGKQKSSKKISIIEKQDGYKILTSGASRKLKPSEHIKTNTISNPISDKYIQDKKEEEKAGKVIFSQVRNAKNDTR